MLNTLKQLKGISIGSAALAAALMAAGCGTDDTSPSRTPVSRNTVKTTPQPLEVTRPAATEPGVTVAAAPEAPREVTYAEAEGAFRDRNYGQATDLFSRYVEQRAGNPWGHYMLGLSAWKAGRLDTAESEFRRTLALDPAHLKSHLGLARVLLDAGRPGEAFTTVEKALAVDGTSGDAHRLLGRACHELGRPDEAVDAYRRAIALNPEDAWSMNNLALIRIQEERFEEALAPLARAIELSAEVAVFYNNLGMALERTGHFQDAEAAYARAVEIDPSSDKAAANGERIAAVVKDAGVPALDLGELARSFVAEIDSWGDASVVTVSAGTAPEAGPADDPVDASVTGAADSTRSEQPR